MVMVLASGYDLGFRGGKRWWELLISGSMVLSDGDDVLITFPVWTKVVNGWWCWQWSVGACNLQVVLVAQGGGF